jgi:putative membrane protein
MRLPWPAVSIAWLLAPAPVWAQERTFDWQWDLHPIWWPFAVMAVSVLLLVLFGWVLLNLAPLILGAIAAVLGIRWLTRASRSSRHDPAIAILRERYARGEITRDEFEARMRDLDGRP